MTAFQTNCPRETECNHRIQTGAYVACAIGLLFAFQNGCVNAELSKAQKQLKSPQLRERMLAVKVLGDLNEKGAIPALIPALDDPQQMVRDAAAAALGKKGIAAVDSLVNVLRNGSANARTAANTALSLIGKPAYDGVLALVNGETKPEVVIFALRALGGTGDERAIPILIARLGDANNDIRKSAIEGLGHFNDPRIFDAVFPLLNDPMLRDMAAIAVGRSGSNQVAKLSAGLTEQPIEMRLALITALGKTRNADALPVLIEQLKKATTKDYPFPPDDTKVKEQTEKAMEELGPTAVAPLIELIRTNEDVWLDSALSSALSSNMDESTVQLVVNELLSGKNETSAHRCASALSFASSPVMDDSKPKNLAIVAMDGLVAAFKSDKELVRNAVASAVQFLPNPRMKQELLSALSRRDLAVVAGAYDFFIQEGVTGSEETLIEAMNKSDSMMMAEAFLNSGNDKLEKAGRAWGSRNGYTVKPSEYPASVRWGVKK